MTRHALILGAGFAGLELAAQLSESLRDEVRVTLVDQNDSFSFGFSKLDVMLGRRPAEDLRLNYRDISLEGVEFRHPSMVVLDIECVQLHHERPSRSRRSYSSSPCPLSQPSTS